MKRNISILDCTLRDGGYINNWCFGKNTIADIFANLGQSGVEIIECGFLRDEDYNPERTVFSSVKQVMPLIAPKRVGTRYFGMIALGDMSIEKMTPRAVESLDGIRLTFHKHDWRAAKTEVASLIHLGYEVCVQPVGTTSYSDDELLALVKDVNKLKPFALYIVDTLGILYASDLVRIFNLVDSHLDKDVRIGFHSHNNLQLSFSNAQALISMHTCRDIIIDTSIYGMGRGVGNLATELLAQYVNDNVESRYSIMPLMNIADVHLLSIFARTPWGYALPYFLSGTVKCHPNYASYLKSRGTLSIEDIAKMLSLLPEEKRDLFDKEFIARLYLDYQDSTVNDTDAICRLSELTKDKLVLIIAPGKSTADFLPTVIDYANRKNVFVIGVNWPPKDIHFDAVFVSNRKRTNHVRDIKEYILATSNLGSEMPPKAMVFNYSSYLGEGEANDNAGAMLIRILKKIRVNEVALAGFDGFELNTASNYSMNNVGEILDIDEMRAKNEHIGRQLRAALAGMKFETITPTKYRLS